LPAFQISSQPAGCNFDISDFNFGTAGKGALRKKPYGIKYTWTVPTPEPDPYGGLGKPLLASEKTLDSVLKVAQVTDQSIGIVKYYRANWYVIFLINAYVETFKKF